MLELDDIQSGVLRPRPTPYEAVYVLFRIDDGKAGRELMRRIHPMVASAAHAESPAGDAWVSVALSFQGLKALGVPQPSLDSFSPEFQQGMAARARILCDTDESSPEHWEKPLGLADVHVVLTGLPLALCPMHDDPELGADRGRNNAFLFKQDDPIGYHTPCGSHIRRANPRDADVAGVVRIHRMIRRGTSYGPLLPDGVLEDDGAERGLMFAFVGANLGRQFEFVQSEWVNDGSFFGGGATKDPVTGAISGGDTYSFPRRPLPVRLQGLSRFVVTRGGEYCFLPGLRALQWLGELES
jgi:deferrochelatase/peroxidase EfeB